MNGRRQNNPEESGAFFPMLQRNLLSTAVTRGRRRVVLVGSRKALAIAVANDRPTQRRTGLRRRLALGSVKVGGSVSRAWPAPTGCFRGHGPLLPLLSQERAMPAKTACHKPS